MDHTQTPVLNRRRLFLVGGGTAAGVTAGVAGALAVPRLTGAAASPPPAPGDPPLPTSVPFDGPHQAGVATRAQGHLLLTAYDGREEAGREELAELLRGWTTAGRALTSGAAVAGDPGLGTGDGPEALTVTVGLGGGLLDRLGLPRPAALVDLPDFEGDQIDRERSDGDLVLQLCADDPMVLAQADRVLRELAAPVAVLRWQDAGFQGAGARRDRRTTRNLMGQLDGTNNTTTGDQTVGGPVWVDVEDPVWVGGSHLVFRRIRMLLDRWEATPVTEQEQVIGRHKVSGAPLGSARETDNVDLEARHPDGTPVIPASSHVRLSTLGPGEQMLRRGYSYRGGMLPDRSTDQGLLFLAYQRDPRTSFVPVQRRLAAADALNAFTLTTGSGVFAVLPGTTDPSDWLGRRLLAPATPTASPTASPTRSPR